MSSVVLFALLFFPISFTPGPNMLLALSFGMSMGFKKTLPLICGVLLGVFCVILLCGLGLGVFLSANETIFNVFMCACALYLGFLAFKMWRKAENIKFQSSNISTKFKALFFYGLTSCLSNAKSWACFVALLPAFLDKANPLNAQLALIILAALLIEFINMSIYTLGGIVLRKVLVKHAILLQRISALLIVFIAILMLLSVFFNVKI